MGSNPTATASQEHPTNVRRKPDESPQSLCPQHGAAVFPALRSVSAAIRSRSTGYRAVCGRLWGRQLATGVHWGAEKQREAGRPGGAVVPGVGAQAA